MSNALIFDHVRTPRGRGRTNGSLHTVPPINLAAQVLKALQARNNLDTAKVDDVALGIVTPVGEQGCNLTRPAILLAGYDQSVSGFQIDRACSSGLDAVNLAASQVMSGQASLTIGGGVESMSRVPMGSQGGAWPRDPEVIYNASFSHQGIAADLIATRSNFSRETLDQYAVESQQRAANAWDQGYFNQSVITVVDDLGLPLLSKDEHLRPEATVAELGKLKPAFDEIGKAGYDGLAQRQYPDVFEINHVHTAGNSSGIVDGASGILIGNQATADKLGLKPRARIRAFATVGSEPVIMLTGPAAATHKALKNAGMSIEDIDLFELNEAFASMVLEYMKELNIPRDKINVNGGAIAMGHPLGATGAMLVGTALDELERTGKKTALISLCVGIGMSVATIIERI